MYDDILIDIGTADTFYKQGQLLPEAFAQACAGVSYRNNHYNYYNHCIYYNYFSHDNHFDKQSYPLHTTSTTKKNYSSFNSYYPHVHVYHALV